MPSRCLRLSAAVGMLACHLRGSRRSVEYLVNEVLGCPLSLGGLMAREQELGQALAGPYQEARGRVAASGVKYIDETSWRRAAQWLFTAATPRACVYGLSPSRTWPAVQKLLGGQVSGTICTDRFGIYEKHPLKRRGVCWAHLKRDFVRCEDRGGVSARLGREGLKVCRGVFTLYRELRGRRLSRKKLARRLRPVRAKIKKLLRKGARCGAAKTAGFCRRVLRLWPALWAFARPGGPEPTNNLAERQGFALRSGCCVLRCCGGSRARARPAGRAAGSSSE